MLIGAMNNPGRALAEQIQWLGAPLQPKASATDLGCLRRGSAYAARVSVVSPNFEPVLT
jgi:hypothetical protein